MVVVIGAGAAGLLAAIRAAECGARVLLLEKNRKPGVKILISGGTRCNLTHNTDRRGIAEAFGRQGRFLRSALAALGPQEVVQLVAAEGVATKVEETGKVFPVSDRAGDVLQAFLRRLHRSGAQLRLDEGVLGLERESTGFRVVTSRRTLSVDQVIVTSGGQSYPKCGTVGEGYEWARRLGHSIVAPHPALTPVTTSASWVRQLSGITLPDVAVKVVELESATGILLDAQGSPGSKKLQALDERRGSFLFTHFGLSGPTPMNVSRAITGHPRPTALVLVCDFVPRLNAEQLAAEVQRECEAAGKRQLANLVAAWVPARVGDALVRELGLSPDHRAAELSKRDRQRLVACLKGAVIPVTGTRGYDKAEVTAGGVSLDEVDSRTLGSKLVPGLYFAGEVLDLDGPIGGFNFQAAFSTGWLAGQSASRPPALA